MAAFGGYLVILPAEGHNDRARFGARQPGDPVAVEAGAVDRSARGEVALGCLDHCLATPPRETSDLGSHDDISAACLHKRGVFLRDGNVVGDSRRRHMQGANSGAVRLNLAQLFRAEDGKVGDAIGHASPVKLLERGQLVFAGSDHHLAANFMGDAVFPAECHHCGCPLHAGLGFEGAGLVVEARMDHPAVVAGLVGGNPVLLLDDQQARGGKPLREGHAGGKPDDAAADNHQIELMLGH